MANMKYPVPPQYRTILTLEWCTDTITGYFANYTSVFTQLPAVAGSITGSTWSTSGITEGNYIQTGDPTVFNCEYAGLRHCGQLYNQMLIKASQFLMIHQVILLFQYSFV